MLPKRKSWHHLGVQAAQTEVNIRPSCACAVRIRRHEPHSTELKMGPIYPLMVAYLLPKSTKQNTKSHKLRKLLEYLWLCCARGNLYAALHHIDFDRPQQIAAISMNRFGIKRAIYSVLPNANRVTFNPLRMICVKNKIVITEKSPL